MSRVSNEVIRDVFLRNGFTVKEGQDDLKPYVYAAARDLLKEVAHLAADAVPVTYQVRDEAGDWKWGPADQGVYQMVKRHRPHDARALYDHPKTAALNEVPTMDDAIAAGDGTLHGAISYWHQRALKAEAALQMGGCDNIQTLGEGIRPATPTTSDREAFEAAYRNLNLTRDGAGYSASDTNYTWNVWNAAVASKGANQ